MGHGEEMEERSDKDGRRMSQPLAAFLPPSLYGASFEVGTPLYLMSSLSTEPCPPSRPRMQSIRCDITAGGRELRRGTKCAAKSAGPSPPPCQQIQGLRPGAAAMAKVISSLITSSSSERNPFPPSGYPDLLSAPP